MPRPSPSSAPQPGVADAPGARRAASAPPACPCSSRPTGPVDRRARRCSSRSTASCRRASRTRCGTPRRRPAGRRARSGTLDDVGARSTSIDDAPPARAPRPRRAAAAASSACASASRSTAARSRPARADARLAAARRAARDDDRVAPTDPRTRHDRMSRRPTDPRRHRRRPGARAHRASAWCSRPSPTSSSSARPPTVRSAVELVDSPRASTSCSWTCACRASTASPRPSRSCRRRPTHRGCIVLTTFDLDEYAFAAIRAGASGFLLKDSRPAELVGAIRTVHAGEAALAPRVTRRMIELFARRAARAPAAPTRRPGCRLAHAARARDPHRHRRGAEQPRDRRASSSCRSRR